MKKFFIALLVSTNALAYSGTYFKVGIGIDDKLGTTKILTTGYQAPLFGMLDYQLEGGMFLDSTQTQGIIGFGGASIGTSVFTPSGLYAKLFVGPSFITQTDNRLSSIFEFNDDFEIGLRDEKGLALGIDFKHLSNAGLWPPNIGRDFMLIKLQIPY